MRESRIAVGGVIALAAFGCRTAAITVRAKQSGTVSKRVQKYGIKEMENL